MKSQLILNVRDSIVKNEIFLEDFDSDLAIGNATINAGPSLFIAVDRRVGSGTTLIPSTVKVEVDKTLQAKNEAYITILRLGDHLHLIVKISPTLAIEWDKLKRHYNETYRSI